MLLAVEGGGFFSSSASGYSKGLSLLFLGRNKEQSPMRVSPWNHYQLVDDEVDSDIQSTFTENRVSTRISCLNCFSRASAQADSPSQLKVDCMNHPENSQSSSVIENAYHVENLEEESESRVFLKSSLKKASRSSSVVAGSDFDVHNLSEELQGSVSNCTERRKLQWLDSCGRELAEVRIFEVSDVDTSDDECEQGRFRRCECVIQ